MREGPILPCRTGSLGLHSIKFQCESLSVQSASLKFVLCSLRANLLQHKVQVSITAIVQKSFQRVAACAWLGSMKGSVFRVNSPADFAFVSLPWTGQPSHYRGSGSFGSNTDLAGLANQPQSGSEENLQRLREA